MLLFYFLKSGNDLLNGGKGNRRFGHRLRLTFCASSARKRKQRVAAVLEMFARPPSTVRIITTAK